MQADRVREQTRPKVFLRLEDHNDNGAPLQAHESEFMDIEDYKAVQYMYELFEGNKVLAWTFVVFVVVVLLSMSIYCLVKCINILKKRKAYKQKKETSLDSLEEDLANLHI